MLEAIVARLPTYEQKAPLMAGIDTIQTPNLQEQIRRSKSIEGSLDVISKFAAGQAEIGIKKQAAQYTVANPLTTKQLEEAQAKGVNPIEAALNGGMVWNDAVQKLYAQQATSELTNSAYKHYEDVYERVKNGQLTDAAIIQRELETPLKSWSNVIAQIDPESANAFYQKRITDGNSYYKASLKELRSKEQERQDDLAKDTMFGMVRQMEVDMKNQEPSVIFAKFLASQQEAEQLFANSPRKESFKNDIQKEFSEALYRHIADELQLEFATIEEVYDQLEKGELGKYSDVWKHLKPTQKNTLQSRIESKYSQIASEYKAELKSITDQGKTIRSNLEEGANVNNWRVELASYTDKIDKLSGPAKAAALEDFHTTMALVSISQEFQSKSLPEIQALISRWDNDPESYPKSYVTLAKDHAKKLEEARDKDLAQYTLTRSGTNHGDIDLLLTGDSKQLKMSFEKQFNAIRSQPDYIPGETNFLTKQQAQRLTRIISSDEITKDQKISVASQIVDAFGADALSVFQQVSPKDPVFAHVGALAVNGTDPNTLATILEGQQFIVESNLDMKSKRKKTKSALALIDAVSLHPGESDRILQAADAYYARMYPDAAGSTNVNDAKYKEAIMAVTGAEGKMGGLSQVNDRFVIIHNDMDFEEFPKYFSTADANDFLSSVVVDTGEVPSITAPNKQQHITEDLANATPKRIGDYYILLDKNGHPFTNESNVPIRFDGHVLQEIYKAKEQFGSLQQDIPLAGKKRVRTGFSSYRYERMGGDE